MRSTAGQKWVEKSWTCRLNQAPAGPWLYGGPHNRRCIYIEISEKETPSVTCQEGYACAIMNSSYSLLIPTQDGC